MSWYFQPLLPAATDLQVGPTQYTLVVDGGSYAMNGPVQSFNIRMPADEAKAA